MISFSRADLADELVTALQGKASFSDAHNGLFLAAPRRTGKTTFLRGDLRWKSARGEYAVEDAAMHRWFEDRKAAGRWPPKSPQSAFDLDAEG